VLDREYFWITSYVHGTRGTEGSKGMPFKDSSEGMHNDSHSLIGKEDKAEDSKAHQDNTTHQMHHHG
jgi:hypothetical protein